MNDFNFDFVKSENLSLDWLQGWLTASSMNDLFSAMSEVGFNPDGFVYYAGFNTRYYRDTFSYLPAFGDIRLQYNAKHKYLMCAESDFFHWTDSNLVDHIINIHSKSDAVLLSDGCYVPSLDITDRAELNQHIYISVSGDGLRFLRHHDLYLPFLKMLRAFDFHCTRLDIALDIYDADNKLVNLIDEAFMYQPDVSEFMVTTHMPRANNINRHSNTYDFNTPNTFALSFGNHGSNSAMLRLYDKLHEMLYGKSYRTTRDLVKDMKYWYRYELEAHNDFSWSLFNYIIDQCNFNLAPAFVLISDKIFKIRVANWNDTHRERYELSVYYEAFLAYLIQNIEFAPTFEIQKRSKREDSFRLYVLNMCKVFFAINKCLASEWIDDVSSFLHQASSSFNLDAEYRLRCSSFRDYYLKLGSELYYKDDHLISRVAAFNLKDVG